MTDTLKTIALGSAGILGVEVSQVIPPETISQIIQTVIQVLIGIATIWGLLRKNRKKPGI